MATVRDQVEAYNYATRRQVLALLKGDDAVSLDPRRRLNRSLFGGLLLGVIVLAAAGVAGFLSSGGSTSVPTSGVIVDADTGATFVRDGNLLHQTLNMTSAKLIAGPQVTKVSSSALRSLPRGLQVGIPGAPDVPPPSSRLTAGAWSVCTIEAQAASASGQVVVSVGAPVPTPIPESGGIVAQTPDGTEWLLDNGQRYKVTTAAAGLLGLNQAAPLSIDPAVLDLAPEGQPLVVPKIPGAGHQPSVSLPFHPLVGDLWKVDNGTNRPGLYVVTQDGIAAVDPFAFQMLLTERTPRTVQAGDLQSVPVRTSRLPEIPAGWPSQAPGNPVPPPASGQPFCISYDPRAQPAAAWTVAWPVSFSTPARVPLGPHAEQVSASGTRLPTAATAVAVPAGGGALVKAVGSGGVDSVYTLITDSGLRFSIADADAVRRLGYDTNAAVRVPLSFVRLLPAGPSLDPAAAAAEDAGAAEAPAATASPVPSAPPS